jgi:hypothetical protein
LKVKNITAGSLSLPVVGRFVDPGETVEVPGEQEFAWDPTYWEAVAEKKSAKADKAEK